MSMKIKMYREGMRWRCRFPRGIPRSHQRELKGNQGAPEQQDSLHLMMTPIQTHQCILW